MGYFCFNHVVYAIQHYTEHSIDNTVSVKINVRNEGTCGQCNETGIFLVTYIPKVINSS